MFDVVVGKFRKDYSPILESRTGSLTRAEAVWVQGQACLHNDTSKAGCERAIAKAKAALQKRA